MSNRQILVGMAATFVGLTALLVVAAVVVNPLLVALAVPIGAVAYLLWYHATGRLRDRLRRRAETAGPRERERARRRARGAEDRRSARGATVGRGAGGDDAVGGGRAGPGAGSDGRGARRGGTGAGRAAGATGNPRDRAPSAAAMSTRAACDVLGVEPSADDDAVRRAYRERAKDLHPDGPDGDEEAFKELTEAYELLSD